MPCHLPPPWHLEIPSRNNPPGAAWWSGRSATVMGSGRFLAGGQVKLAGPSRINQTWEPDGRGNSGLGVFGSATRPELSCISHMTLGPGLSSDGYMRV